MIAGAELLPVLTPEKPASENPANEVSKKLTGRDYVSWSALSTFRTCPLKYKYRNIDGLPEESVSSALVFGTGIHTAVELHFQALLSGDPKPDLDVLLFAYRSAWLPHEPDAIQYGSTETRASLDALAARMLTTFLNSPAASVQGRVLGVEEEIRGGCHRGGIHAAEAGTSCSIRSWTITASFFLHRFRLMCVSGCLVSVAVAYAALGAGDSISVCSFVCHRSLRSMS